MNDEVLVQPDGEIRKLRGYGGIRRTCGACRTVLGKLTGMEGVWFAGTSVLIMTGVANDLVDQIESQMVTHNYKGFLV